MINNLFPSLGMEFFLTSIGFFFIFLFFVGVLVLFFSFNSAIISFPRLFNDF